MKIMKLKTKRTFNLLPVKEIEQFIRDMYKTLNYEYDFILNNLNPYSFNTMYDLAETLLSTVLPFGYNIYLDENNTDEYYLATSLFVINQPRSVEVCSVIRSKKTLEKNFLLNVMGYMVSELQYPSVDDYRESHEERLMEWTFEDENGYSEQDIKEEADKLLKFSNLLPKNLSISAIDKSFETLINKSVYENLVELIHQIDNIPLGDFELCIDDEVSFFVSMRIEYDFDNLLTENYTNEIDEIIDNSSISDPRQLIPLGDEIKEPLPFEPYIELIEELSKIVENEFT